MKAVVLLACVLLPLGVVGARMMIEGRQALVEAERLADHGDLGSIAARISLLGRAARRLGGPASAARGELAEMGRRGIPAAWDELCGAILATRWLLTPDAALLDEADHALATRRATEVLARRSNGPAVGAALAAEEARQLERLRSTGEPSRALSMVALAGFVAFLAAVGHLLFRGRSRAAVAGAALGFVTCLLGLWRA